MIRLLHVGNFTYGKPSAEEEISNAFKRQGWEVIDFKANEVREGEKNIKDEAPYDYALFGKSHLISGVRYSEARKYGAKKIFCWYADCTNEPITIPTNLAAIKNSDLFFGKCRIHNFPNFIWLPHDFAQSWCKSYNSEKLFDWGFIGSFPFWDAKAFRIELISYLFKNWGNINYSINGTHYKKWWGLGAHPSRAKPLILNDKFAKRVSEIKVNISVESIDTFHNGFWSDRICWIMACGGFALVQARPGMKEHFKDYVEYFTTKEECLEKTKYWSEHDEERKERAKKGMEFVLKNHTVDNRVKELIKYYES